MTERKTYPFRPLLTDVVLRFVDFHPHGLENLEILEKTPALFPFGPHCGHFDTPIVLKAFPKELQDNIVFEADKEYWFDKPMRKYFAERVIGMYPMPKKGFTKEDYKTTFEEKLPALLAQRKSLAFSPEGTRNAPVDTPLAERRFKPGVGALVRATHGQYPVIPVRIIGAEYLMPKHKNIPNKEILLNGIIHVVFGEKIDYQNKPHLTSKQITLDIQNKMNNLKPPEMWSRARSGVI